MFWIGLSGGIASGKSTVTQLIRTLGESVIDADALSHQVIEVNSSGYDEIVKLFGQSILNSDGSINRKYLAQVVFNNANDLLKLEQIIHPRVFALAEKQKKQWISEGKRRAFFDVPLLFEKKMQSQFDATVLVYCPEVIQRQRLKNIRQLTDAEVDLRIKSQMPMQMKLNLASYVIFNDGALSDLKIQTEKMLSFFTTPTHSPN